MARMEKIDVGIRPQIAAVARPGDIVIIGFNRALSDEDVDRLTENFEDIGASGVRVGFVDNVTGMVVIKGEESPADTIRGMGEDLKRMREKVKSMVCEECDEGGDDEEIPVPAVDAG